MTSTRRKAVCVVCAKVITGRPASFRYSSWMGTKKVVDILKVHKKCAKLLADILGTGDR